MNLSNTDLTWHGKALLIAGAVALMLGGDQNLRATTDTVSAVHAAPAASVQWVQHEVPSMPQTVVRPASQTAQARQVAANSQPRWVF